MTKEKDEVTWWDWIVSTTPELVAAGIPREEVAHLRFEKTGLRRPMTRQWAQTIGLWGGQKTCKEMADFTGLPATTVRPYAAYRGLGMKKRGSPRVLQVEVAYHAFKMKKHYEGRSLLWICKMGCSIMPPEYVYYTERVAAFEDMIREAEGLELQELFDEFELVDVQGFWVASKCELKAPHEKAFPDIRTRLRR